MSARIVEGEALAILRTLPDGIAQTCVTSPPYWRLRDYGHDDQLGLEDTPEEYVNRLVGIFREVRRVLRDDGTLWLNLGDSYIGPSGGQQGKNGQRADRRTHRVPEKRCSLKDKDLVGIPWRVALALQADGWWLRSEVIWHKPNPLPESVGDRPVRAHEHVFLLAKAERYYYDAGAVREPAVSTRPSGSGFAGRMGGPSFRAQSGGEGTATPWSDVGGTRSLRDVWTLPTQPSSFDHDAQMPPALARRCILAGAPAGGLVLDPFAGSGTTLIEALELGRDALGIELVPRHVQLIEDRIARAQPALPGVA